MNGKFGLIVIVKGGEKRSQKREDRQVVAACRAEIRRIRRVAALPDVAVPEYQRKIRELCEKHGWPVPKEAGQ